MDTHRIPSECFEHAATGFAITDVNGNIVDVNHEFARIVDRNRAKIGGANVFEWTHPEDHSRHQALLRQLVAAGDPKFRH
jgi:PAS domain S-box-containing protein